MITEEEFIVEEEWVEEDFIDGESYEEEVMEEDVVEDEVRPGNLLQRATSNADFSFDGSSIVEFDLGSYNGESSSGEGEPDNYDEACRALIKQVYPQGGSHDEDDIIRRCDLRNLYRNLKQQQKFLIHSKKALAENGRRPEKWESFDDSNGAFSVESADQAVISFDEPLQEVETKPKNGSEDRQIWPEMEGFADPWGNSKARNESTNGNRDEHGAIRRPAAVEETQDQVMMEAQGESSEGQLVPWLLRHADDPDDYEAACRELIAIIYKGEDEADVDTMLRRSDPKDLYRHLKHQHWYLTHTGAISEKPVSNGNVAVPIHHAAISEKSEPDKIVDFPMEAGAVSEKPVSDTKALGPPSRYNKGPSLDDIWLVTEGDDEMEGEAKEKPRDSNIERDAETSQDLKSMDEDQLPIQALDEIENIPSQFSVVDVTSGILNEAVGDVSAQIEQLVLAMRSMEETNDKQEGQVIKWLDRYADDPGDYEEANRKLVSMLYSEDDEYDAETTLSRSSPKDLFRYLKQQYWYRVHMGTLPENALEQRFSTSSFSSGKVPGLSESTNLIDTVKSRISLIQSTNFGETHEHQQRPSTSPSGENTTLAAPMESESEMGQSPRSKFIQTIDRTSPSEKSMQQISSITANDGMTSSDGMHSSDSSSLEPPPGYDSQTLIKDRTERLEKAGRDNPKGGEINHIQSQNLEGSFRTDASSVYSHENIIDEIEMDRNLRHAILDEMNSQTFTKDSTPERCEIKHTHTQNLEGSSRTDASSVFSHENNIDEIKMDGTLRHAILDQMNQEDVTKLNEPNQESGEKSKSSIAPVAVHPITGGLPEHLSRQISTGTHPAGSVLADVENSSIRVTSDKSRVGNTGLQASKRSGFADSPSLDSNKRAKNEVDMQFWSRGREKQRLLQQDNYEQARSLDGDIRLSKIQKVDVNVQTMGEEEKRMWDNFDSPSTAGEEIGTESVSAHHGHDVIITGKLNVDGDEVQSIGGEDVGTDEAFLCHDHDIKKGRLDVNRDDVQSIGGDEIGTEEVSAQQNQGVMTGEISLDGDDTNSDIEVDGTDGVNASVHEATSPNRRAADKAVIVSSSPANAQSQEQLYQAQIPKNSSKVDRVDMAKRQNRIEEELFPIVSDAEKISGEVFTEEILAALILAATKTAHLKRYYNFIMGTFVFLPPVANAVVDGSLLDCASRHLGGEIQSQYTAALIAASEMAVDSNLDYEYMDSHAVTLDITFPKSPLVVQKPKISNSKLDTKGDTMAFGPLDPDKKVASAMHYASEHELSSLNNEALKDGDHREFNPADLTELEEEAKLLFANYQETKSSLWKESAEIEKTRNLEKERIARELDSIEDLHKQAVSTGARKSISTEEDLLAKQLEGLRESLSTAENSLKQERSRSHSAVSGEENSTGLFGIFGVRRRAMDLEKEKEQQAKLMQQKIHEMEIEQKMEQIIREIATVQTKYDELREIGPTLSTDGNMNAKKAALLQESQEIEERFLEARNVLIEGLDALEERRLKDETWYHREKAAILATFPTSSNEIEDNTSKSVPMVRQINGAVVPFQAPHDEEEEAERVEAKGKLESNTQLSSKANVTSQLSEGLAYDDRRLVETVNDANPEVVTRPGPSETIPDHLVGANQPVAVNYSDMDSLASAELFDQTPSQPWPIKTIRLGAQKAQDELMQTPSKSSPFAEDSGIGEEKDDIVADLGGVEGILPDHLMGSNQPNSRAADLESLTPLDVFGGSPGQSRPDKPLLAAAMLAKEAMFDQRESKLVRNQLGEKDPAMGRTYTTQQGTEKKMLMLFSSTTVDLSQRTNQHRAVVVLKAQNIDYESMDGSDPNAVAKRNELFKISSLWGTYPQFFVVERGSTSFVGTFESIQDLNDRGLLKSLVDNREEHYRQEFMELLERDDRGETVDEDRLYHLQLYARRRVGEELTTSERLDLEEFEREEAKLESTESPRDSVLHGDEVISDKAKKDDSFDVLKPSSLGNDRVDGIKYGESSPAGGADGMDSTPAEFQHAKLLGSSPSSVDIEPSHSQSSIVNHSSNPDRLLAWRKNGKRMVAEKLQASMSQDSAREARNGLEETLERGVPDATDILVASKASLQDKTERKAHEKKSRLEVLAEKRKQIAESRRVKWGLKSDKNAASGEKLRDKTLGDESIRLDPSIADKRKKQRIGESKRLAEKTAKAREARLAREAELRGYTEQVKQKGRVLKEKLEKQSSAEENDASSSRDIQWDKPVSTNEGSLLPPLVKEVGRLSGFISRYERKLETTCKSILSVVQKTGQNADLKRVLNLDLPEMYSYITDQPWFKEHASDSFSRPLSVSKRGKESIIKVHLAAFNGADDGLTGGSARTGTISTELKMYKLSKLGEQFIAIDGPGCGDTGRFLSSLASSESLSKKEIRERWSDISRLSGDSQSDRICTNIEDFISFCASSGLID